MRCVSKVHSMLIGISQPPSQVNQIEHPRLCSTCPTSAIACVPPVKRAVREFIFLCFTPGNSPESSKKEIPPPGKYVPRTPSPEWNQVDATSQHPGSHVLRTPKRQIEELESRIANNEVFHDRNSFLQAGLALQYVERCTGIEKCDLLFLRPGYWSNKQSSHSVGQGLHETPAY
jgi:hypothetical protein